MMMFTGVLGARDGGGRAATDGDADTTGRATVSGNINGRKLA